MRVYGVAGTLSEWSFTSQKARKDPWSETSVMVRIVSPDGRIWVIPAFWAGDQEWRVRFTPAKKGAYGFRIECADSSDAGLHGVEGILEVAPTAANSDNLFVKHGAVQMSSKGNGFEHEDGTPFLHDWVFVMRKM